MSSQERTIVVGGGLLGLATAYALLERGMAVQVLECENGIGLGASRANGGMITPALCEPWNAPGIHRHLLFSSWRSDSALMLRLSALPSLFTWGTRFLRHATAERYHIAVQASYQLCAYSLSRTRELRERLELTYDSAAAGTLKIFDDAQAMDASIKHAQLMSRFGLQYQALDSMQAVEVEPQLAAIRDRISGALLFPDDESGDSYLFCQALANHIRQHGGEILLGTAATGLIESKGRIIAITTRTGRIEARRVVVAAGNRSVGLLKSVGLRLPIHPVKGYSLTLDGIDADLLPRMPLVSDALHAAITPLGSRIRVVGSAEFAGWDITIRPSRIRNLTRLLETMLPQLAARADISTAVPWAGLRPVSADGLPYIGPTKVQGLHVNTGHGHVGWTMALGSGEILADLLTGATPDIDAAPYSAVRGT